ncbi:hypothetical protein CAOG_08806 [Capsaspora owczarzaki ATCC 30864]|uniref:phosphoethanolamine N-methyltransferase n=1 Tax=Capsaspora owczarzaki (strain ATCC 30864) TaxID=595528 RepID=A0A0D2X3B0_CAPO3|nr:hypothetical protein CAOG_08806 [Capsaspora owczarzaki ATCC 30864]KJE93994.1 hypothetical protein CAOG_008806 [Capsaspora owczarzaki ATCC 30864]|eukprot:XP_011270446.1 hypothetical protein CAOG_08806 [Capsaspora owczarzaki ATCC 30864]
MSVGRVLIASVVLSAQLELARRAVVALSRDPALALGLLSLAAWGSRTLPGTALLQAIAAPLGAVLAPIRARFSPSTEPDASRPASAMDRRLMFDMYDIQSSKRALLNLRPPTETWMNFGLWPSASALPPSYGLREACEALATLLAHTVELNSQDTLLDVGCGCGDQDVLFAKTFQPKSILGVEIAPSQVAQAQCHIQRHGLESNVQVVQGSAVDLAASCRAARQFSVVLSLDSAYHYALRRDFVHEAFRVLQPTGRLGLVDICVTDSWQETLCSPAFSARLSQIMFRLGCKAAAIPLANMVSQTEYASQLSAAGFEDVHIRDISDQVFEGFARHIETTAEQLASVTRPLDWIGFRLAARLMRFLGNKRVVKFIVVKSVKPATRSGLTGP